VQHWAVWVGGLALSGVIVANWLLAGRQMAVSGRYTALVDRALGAREEALELSAEELAAAVRAATLEEFGAESVEAPGPTPIGASLRLAAPVATSTHALFLASLAVGGFLSAWIGGHFDVTPSLASTELPRLLGRSAMPALFAGGVLVGFGTRMAAGCTSGHGLCGVSRAQPGSLISTGAFFGMGILASFLLEWL